MRTFAEIYSDLLIPPTETQRYNLKFLLDHWQVHNDWIGRPEQLLKLKELQLELTGIRPGGCNGCNIEVINNMMHWAAKYEMDLKLTKKKK